MGRRFRLIAGVVGYFATASAVATAQTAQIEAELRARLAALRAQQPGPEAPKSAAPKAAPNPPAGVVARLGHTRLRHAAQPTCVAISPDGKKVYSGGEDGTLRVWDVETGAALGALTFPDDAVARTPAQLQFTPDGRRLLVRNANGLVSLYDPATLLRESVLGNAAGRAVLSPGGKYIAGVSPAGVPTVTETDEGLPKLELDAGDAFAFHPDGRSIAAADAAGKVTLYLLAGGKPLATLDNGVKLDGMAFSPDGKRLACGAGEVAKVWEFSGGSPRLAVEVKDAGQVRGWLGNDRFAAGDGKSGGVYSLAEKKWGGRAEGISGEWAVSADGTKAAATTPGGLRVRLWDLTTGKQLHAENDTFTDVTLLAPTADGKGVFVLAGASAHLWAVGKDAASPGGRIPAGKAVAAAAGKNRLAVATGSGILVYDDFDPAKPLPAKPVRVLTEHTAECKAVAVSADGKTVAYSGPGGKTVISDAATGKTVRVLPVQTEGLALAFDPTGETLVVLGRDGFLRRWSATGGGDETDLWKVRIQRGRHGTVAFSPDGKLVAASSSGVLKVVSAADGSGVCDVGGLFDNGLIQHAAFSPDGRRVFTASEGATGGVIVWDVETRKAVRRFATGYGTVYLLGVFPGGGRVVSAGAEEAITVWDVRAK